MKKIKYILLLLLIIPITCKAEVRTKENNYGVNKKWKITEKNIKNVLSTEYVDASQKIYDFSDILTDEEEKIIKTKIDNFIEYTGMDMVFVSTNLPYQNDRQNEDYAADFYDYNDFGINFENYSGVLLLRNTYEANPYFNVYMFGKAQLYYTFNRAESMLDHIFPYFKSHQYLQGINIFINDYTSYYNEGIPDERKNFIIDDNGFLKKTYNAPWSTIIFGDLLITSTIIIILISRNKMVKQKLETINYIEPKGVTFTKVQDIKTGEHTTRYTESSSYSSGSSSHGGGGGFSSSGSSGGGHSSGGGRHG